MSSLVDITDSMDMSLSKVQEMAKNVEVRHAEGVTMSRSQLNYT